MAAVVVALAVLAAGAGVAVAFVELREPDGTSARTDRSPTSKATGESAGGHRDKEGADEDTPRPFRPRPTIVTHGPRQGMRVALTFDADLNPSMKSALVSGRAASAFDRSIIEQLEETKTPATIFMTGMWAEYYPRAAKRLAHSPLFEVENHSYDHSAFDPPCYGLPTVQSTQLKEWEVREAAGVIERITGIQPRYFRFPGGCHTSADVRLVAREGEQAVQWDVVGGDPGQPNAAAIVAAVLDQVRPGSIVVLHLNGAPNAPATSQALRSILPGLRERGFKPVTLEKLLGTGPR